MPKLRIIIEYKTSIWPSPLPCPNGNGCRCHHHIQFMKEEHDRLIGEAKSWRDGLIDLSDLYEEDPKFTVNVELLKEGT